MRKRKKVNYRKIYEQNYGPIPRGNEIHHKDGNFANNEPINLQLVTLQEHYNIHKKRGDYDACQAILMRMKISIEEDFEIRSKAQKERVKNGTHNFLGGEQNRKRFLEGNLLVANSEWQRKEQQRRIKNGTHVFLGGEMQRRTQLELIAKGKHHSQKTYICPECGKHGQGQGMKRWHFDNCKEKIDG